MNKRFSLFYNVLITVFAVSMTVYSFITANTTTNHLFLLIDGMINGALLIVVFLDWVIYFVKK